MLLQTFYIGRDKAYRSVAAASAHETNEEIILIDAPAGANRLWRLDGRHQDRPYVTADWVMAWKLAAADARRIRALDVVG